MIQNYTGCRGTRTGGRGRLIATRIVSLTLVLCVPVSVSVAVEYGPARPAATAGNNGYDEIVSLPGRRHNMLMRKLIDWLIRHSYLTHPGTALPDIHRTSPSDLSRIAFGKGSAVYMKRKTLDILGLYNYRDNAIYLHEAVNLDTVRGRSVLLHELVHYLQYQERKGRSQREFRKREQLAYKLEVNFLKQYGMGWLNN